MSKILVIDDQEELRKVVATALNLEGFEVLQASNGAEGVELARQQLPELILCDVMMDRVDGYTALRQLREDPATAPIPCILMTGNADSTGMRQGMELGADDYLPKPFQISQLLAAVEARLKKQKTLRQEAEKKLDVLRANLSLALPHELRTPLNGILGYAEMIFEDVEQMSREEIAKVALSIRASGLRLNRLIENFLIYSQIAFFSRDSRIIPSLRQPQAEDFQAQVRKLIEDKMSEAGRLADLKLEMKSARGAITPEYLGKMLGELLDNAMKFSKPGTPITIRSSVEESAWVISVQDQGRGMSSEQVLAIGAYMQFERNFHEQQGAGLGLVIVKRLAELHEGSLKIDSGPGEGTCVTIRLPA